MLPGRQGGKNSTQLSEIKTDHQIWSSSLGPNTRQTEEERPDFSDTSEARVFPFQLIFLLEVTLPLLGFFCLNLPLHCC